MAGALCARDLAESALWTVFRALAVLTELAERAWPALLANRRFVRHGAVAAVVSRRALACHGASARIRTEKALVTQRALGLLLQATVGAVGTRRAGLETRGSCGGRAIVPSWASSGGLSTKFAKGASITRVT